MKRSIVVVSLISFLALALSTVPPAQASMPGAAQPAEFRAFWVDAFGAGIYSEAEIDQLVADTKAANLNAIVAQVGRRGDCFCNKAAMPRTQAAIAPYPFDPLQTLIEKAHSQGIEVHAWVIATTIWSSTVAPVDPAHVYNTHGPSKTGDDNWLMLRNDGRDYSGTADRLLDPGHPDAADYIVRMFTSIVANYDVDGINFDRIRYPDSAGPLWGYNPVSVARFQGATGRTDVPAPTDAQWLQWRRDQVTNIVRRVYLEATSLKPGIRVSADTIPYGNGPVSTAGGWEGTRTYAEVLQDWRGWMEEGILDLNIPMNYKREHLVTEPNNQQRMYLEWNEFIKDHQYDRQAAIGTALYLNSIENSVIQVRKARAPSAAGNSPVGWVGYSYRTPSAAANENAALGRAERAALIRALTQPSEYDPVVPPVFAEPAAVPEMTWKTQPAKGHLMGTVKAPAGPPFDQLRVDLVDADTDALVMSRMTDGTGWFGFVDLAPGQYRVKLDPARAGGLDQADVAQVVAGKVATMQLTAGIALDESRIYLPFIMRTSTIPALSAPVLAPIDNSLRLRNFTVSWAPVSGANGYTLEESTNGDFVGAATVYTGPAMSWVAQNKAPATYIYRVNANGPAGNSLWSNTEQTSPSAPSIEFTSIPQYGTPGYLRGRVWGAVPADHKIAVYIFVSGWWTKPYWASPLTSIAPDGTWLTNISTGGNDVLATQIAAFLIPNGYAPSSMSGQATLPPELYANSLAYLVVERHPARTLSFAGRTWYVKAAEWNADPGPCYYSDQPEDVWVDDQGRLHLRIAYRNSRWYCAEVFSADITGHGTYTFTLASPTTLLDSNVVLGLFAYDDTNPAYSHREIDIEFARWGLPTGPNSQYVVQPYTNAGHRYQFDLVTPELYSMHRFIWRPDSVSFASFAGNQSPPDPSSQLNSYTHTDSDIPPAGNGNARINLWLFGGSPPSDNREVEAIIQDFQYRP